MSRIGKMPVSIPKGVTVKITGYLVEVKGPKGELNYTLPRNFKVEIVDNVLTVTRPSDSREDRSLHGLARNLIRNMVVGVSEGYTRTLEIVGVGYKVAAQGKSLKLNVGYSHPVVIEPEPGIELEAPSVSTIVVKGIDKCKVGQFAANVRAIRPPEPYKGKGIKYSGEIVRRKVGKAGAK
jgi:large subunit ribosomal protein L6